MNKNIFAAVSRGNEAKTLVCVEPFYSVSHLIRHIYYLLNEPFGEQGLSTVLNQSVKMKLKKKGYRG